MHRFKALVREIHRRSLWQVLGIYAVGSWVVYQVVLGVYEGVGLPDWVPATALLLLLVGLPIVLATAFVQEGPPPLRPEAPGGDGRSGPAEPEDRAANAALPDEPRPPSVEPRTAALFTWPRALTGGVLAFAALGVAASGFMGMRTLGIGPAGTLMAKGAIDARDPIVLADFTSPASDAGLGDVVTDALRIDLLSSPVIRLVDDPQVQRVLERMRRDTAAVLDLETAREVALREGYRAVIGGEIGAVGSGFVLTARVVSAESGEPLAGFREAAAGPAELLPAIDRLSRSIREKVGESLKSARSGEPLDRVTTSSLEALRLYSQALRIADRQGEMLRAVGLLEEAIALDPGFAMAHRKIGVLLGNLGMRRARQVEAVTDAYRNRDRLTDRERGIATAYYLSGVAGDRAGAMAAYQNVLDRYPDDGVALNNLALAHIQSGDPASAEALLGESVRAGTPGNVHHINYITALYELGRVDEARRWLDTFRIRFPDSYLPLVGEAFIHAGESRWDSALAAIDGVTRRFTSPLARARAAFDAGNVLATRGRLRDAASEYERLATIAGSSGLRAAALGARITEARTRAWATGDARAASLALEDALARTPLDSLPPLDRPFLELADAYLAAGDLDRAAALLDEYERTVPPDQRADGQHRALLLRALVQAERGDQAGARDPLQAALRVPSPCVICGLELVGRVHETLGDGEAALRAYEAYVGTRAFVRLELDATALPFALDRLGALHEARGDHAAAALYYARFLELWEDADPELRPRVDAARRAVERLSAER